MAFRRFTPSPNPWLPLVYFLSIELPILFHVSGSIYYVVFHVSFIHSMLCLQGPSIFQHQHFIPFMAKEYSMRGYLTFVYPFISGRNLGYFHFLALVNIWLLWTFVYKSVWTYVFISLGSETVQIGAKLLHQMFNICWGTANMLFSSDAPFHIPTSKV